jgi:integrase
MALSDTLIRNTKPTAKQRKLFDTGKGAVPGLFLLIRPPASKLWRLRFWLHGKERLLALGAYPEQSLAEARGLAVEARKLVANDVDPVESKRVDAASRARAAGSTFAALAQRWLDDGAWIPATHKQYARLLERDIRPALGKRPVETITRHDLNRLLEAAARPRKARDLQGRPKRIGGVVSARTVRHIVAGVLDLAVDEDLVAVNVARERRVRTKGKRRSEAHEPTPYRSLTADGLRDLLVRLDRYGGAAETIAAIKLLMHCFTRPSETRCARWEEFNLDAIGGAIWQIPAKRMKARRPHDVPLSLQAVALLRELHRLTGRSGWLFPNIRDAAKPMGSSTLQRALEYLEVDSSPHGFRHSASTILHDHGFDTLVIERQLAHKDRNATRAAYNQATYSQERRRMLQHWADWLDQLKAGAVPAGNVVAIR